MSGKVLAIKKLIIKRVLFAFLSLCSFYSFGNVGVGPIVIAPIDPGFGTPVRVLDITISSSGFWVVEFDRPVITTSTNAGYCVPTETNKLVFNSDLNWSKMTAAYLVAGQQMDVEFAVFPLAKENCTIVDGVGYQEIFILTNTL